MGLGAVFDWLRIVGYRQPPGESDDDIAQLSPEAGVTRRNRDEGEWESEEDPNMLSLDLTKARMS
jgi:hypothetical protein